MRWNMVLLVAVGLCIVLPSLGSGEPSSDQETWQTHIAKLVEYEPTLRMILENNDISIDQNPDGMEQAQRIFLILRDRLKFLVDPVFGTDKSLDPRKLQIQKRGSPRDVTFLFAACLQTCEIPTCIVSAKNRWFVLFQVDEGTPNAVQWQEKWWTAIELPSGKWGDFEGLLKRGRAGAAQLTSPGTLVLDVNTHWRYIKATEATEETVETLLNDGITYGQRGEIEEAQACFERLLKLHPRHAAAIHNLGNTYLLAEDLKEAAKAYERALVLAPGDVGIHLSIGIAYFEMWERAPHDAASRKELRQSSQEALNTAFGIVPNSDMLCRYLRITPQDPEFQKYSALISEAEKRVTGKSSRFSPVGGRGKTPKIPVYWKTR